MSSNPQVVVVGGGPSGVYAARMLAVAGVTVLLLEEHDSLGMPVHCTGILASEAFDRFQISRSSVLNELRTVNVFSPSGRVVSYTDSRAEAVVIDRKEFDKALGHAAEDAGVTIFRGKRVTGIELKTNGVNLETSSGETIKAEACILASGANYGLHLRLGLGLPDLYLKSAQLEVPISTPNAVEIYLGSDIASKGFAWAVPVKRPSGWCCRVGLMCEGDPELQFRKLFERIGSRWGMHSTPQRPRIRLLPLAPICKTFCDRLLIVGDAAGRVKPTTGGGIYYGLLSAEVAAQVMLEALRKGDLSSQALAKYEDNWQNENRNEINAQIELREIVQRLSDKQLEDLIELARTDGILPLVRQTARFNEHREFIKALLKHAEVRRILFQGISKVLA